MSPMCQKLALSLVSIILVQFISVAICKRVELTCPTATASISRRRLLLTKQSSQSLDSSCFGLNITVNVENILPDPAYILPEDNINAISDGIVRTLDECDMTIESNETDNTWIIDNQCDQYGTISHTVDNKQFVTTQYTTSCDDNTLNINDTSGTITCQVTFPESIVYVWHLQQINLYIDIDFCSEIVMQAKICYQNESIPKTIENVITVSEPVTVQEDALDKKYEFVFNPTNNTLKQNTTYYVKFEVTDVIGKYDNLNDKFEYENVDCDEIITLSTPSSCSLGKYIAVTKEFAFGLHAFCNESLAEPERQLFESIQFQKHSSQDHISGYVWDTLEKRRRRNLLGNDPPPTPGPLDSGSQLSTSSGTRRRLMGESFSEHSLISVNSDGTIQTFGNGDSFPALDQCIAVDEMTRRVFSVGGNDCNGNALDRLAIYYLESQSNIVLLDYPNLKLDKPRAMTSCYYYKRDDEEYIIAVNGMNHTKYSENSDCWYNDVVFIPLNEDNKNCDGFPSVKLKTNVIDIKPFVTENDILYLVGGRNEQNATNIIQIIDLDQVFNVSDGKKNEKRHDPKTSNKKREGKKKKKSDDVTTLTAFERMAPMSLNRVLPLVDFTFVANKTCMISWSGQNYINQEYININDSMVKLEMYCNKLLIAYYNTNRWTLEGTSANLQFTEYDKDRLLTPNNDEIETQKDSTWTHDYDFQNDGLWYKFWAEFQICFDDRDEMQNKINFFSDINLYNREILEENILIESQKNYRDWSYGFGAVDICNIDIIDPTPCPTGNSKENNDKNVKKTRRYKSMVPGMLDIEKENYSRTPQDGNNMMPTIIMAVLCVIFLVWISIVCCWSKYMNTTKYEI